MVLATSVTSNNSTTYDVSYCESLAKKSEMMTLSDLPTECRMMESVQKILLQKRTDAAASKNNNIDPFHGMSNAHKVRGQYNSGKETHHQIQRRLTTGATIGQRRFSKLDK